jgi:hypothetical protein
MPPSCRAFSCAVEWPDVYPRFSSRRLLIFVAASAAICYFLFVRPTVVALRFAESIEAADRDSIFPQYFHQQQSLGDKIEVSIAPRTWEDFYKCRRRIAIETSRVMKNGAYTLVRQRRSIATPFGVQKFTDRVRLFQKVAATPARQVTDQ